MAVMGWLVWGTSCLVANGAVVPVDSLADLGQILKSARPGSVIELADGTYRLQRDLEFKRLQGTAEEPIVVRAQHRLRVTLTGEHVVKFRDSQHFVLEWFRLRLKSDVNGKGGAVSVRGCRHCRITGNDFELDESGTGKGNQSFSTLTNSFPSRRIVREGSAFMERGTAPSLTISKDSMAPRPRRHWP
jgi:hypothetical protein